MTPQHIVRFFAIAGLVLLAGSNIVAQEKLEVLTSRPRPKAAKVETLPAGKTVQTGAHERKRFRLPDGSTVDRLWQALVEGDPGVYWSRPWSLFSLLDWCQRERMSL